MMKTDKVKTGGRACKQYNCVRIPNEKIMPTVEHFCATVGIPLDQTVLLGSTGKNPLGSSGDVDLGVSDYYVQANLFQNLEHPAKFNPGFGMWHIPWPIFETAELVQIDIIPTCDLSWAKFAFDANFTDCPYSGATRNALLNGIVSTMCDPRYDYFKYDESTNALLMRIGRLYDRRLGVVPIIKVRDSTYAKFSTIVGYKANLLRNELGLLNPPHLTDIHDVHEVLFGTRECPDRWSTTYLMSLVYSGMFDADRIELIEQVTREILKGFGGKYIHPPQFG